MSIRLAATLNLKASFLFSPVAAIVNLMAGHHGSKRSKYDLPEKKNEPNTGANNYS